MRAAIYARVSTPEQKKNYSLPTQIAACQTYALEKGFEIAAEFREDFTGSELSRPELDKLRALIERGEIDVVLTFKLDRLARDFVIPFIIEREFEAYGVEVRYVNARYDESESGDMMKALDAIVAHQEKRNIIERLIRGKRAAVSEGKIIMNRGQVEIYGYKRVNKLYVIDEEEAGIVRLIFVWYLEGDETGEPLGSAQIAMRLDAMGIPTPLQRHPEAKKRRERINTQNDQPHGWHRGTISRILANEAYTGVLYYGKTKTVKAPGRSRNRKLVPVPPEEWIRCNIPPIIDRETWERARQKAQDNYTFSPRNTQFDYLMRQHLKCSRCGYSLWGYTAKNRHAYYKCKGTDNDLYIDGKARCTGVIRADLVDAAVWQHISELLKNPQQIIDVLQANQAEFKRKESPLRLSLDSTTVLLVEARQERERLVKGYTKGLITEEEFAHEGQEVQERIEALTLEQEKLQAQLSKQTIPDHIIDDLTKVFEQIREGIENFTFDDKRYVLKLLNISGVVQRGPTRKDDVLILTGYIPKTTISLMEAYKLQRTPEYPPAR
jgi:site-specific DNA recombinase